jgi:hypothetical protein
MLNGWCLHLTIMSSQLGEDQVHTVIALKRSHVNVMAEISKTLANPRLECFVC